MMRFDRVRQSLEEAGLAALALVPGPNLHYLLGLEMHQSERVTLAFLPVQGVPTILLPVLEAPRVRKQLPAGGELFPWPDDQGPRGMLGHLRDYLRLGGERIGVEERHMRLLEWQIVRQLFPESRIEPADLLLARQRMIKDAGEIRSMRTAAAALEQGLRSVLEHLRPGMTEREAARAWQWAVAEAGVDRLPEEPIVAAGPNGASPHATPTDRPMQEGELVTFDGVARVDGYYGDLTRTVALGEPGEELRRIYDLVLRANAAGRQVVRPGVVAQEVDRVARALIEAGGYGEAFLHRSGHGLGLEVHEPPYIAEGDDQVLQAGMTFTVEPGIYVEGLGGVRIEDDVVVTPDGAESLTTMTRDLMVL